MVLITVSIRVEESQLKWLDEKVKRNDFASRAHGIRYCIQHIMDESDPIKYVERISKVAKALGMGLKEESKESKSELT